MADVNVLLKPREAAAALGVSYPTLKQWILAGTLKTIKTPGGHTRIPQRPLTPLTKPTPPHAGKKQRPPRARQPQNRRPANPFHHPLRRRPRDAAPQRPDRRCPHQIH